MTYHVSRIKWALFAVLAVAAVWSVVSLVGGIEMRAFQQRIHNGDSSKLKTPLLAQSFVSTRDNLSRVEIQLAQPPAASLPADMDAMIIQGEGPGGTPLYSTRVGAPQIMSDAGASYLSFAFPPIANSSGVTYTFALQTTGYSVNSVLQPAYSPIDALSSGAMYTEDGPQAGDLTLATYYRYNLAWLITDTWNAVASNLLNILAWLAIFLLPGLALLMGFPNGLSAGQKLLAAPGLSALSVPVLYLLASIVGVPIGRNKLLALLALCALAIAWRVVDRKSQIVSHLSSVRADLRSTIYDLRSVTFWVTFVLIMGITAATRLVSLRDIPAGEGMDTYHHTLITALFLRDAGIPSGYAPFAPLASFTYHFGFHSLSATIAWLTGSTQITDLMALVPRVGQITSSVLPIPALVLFGWRVVGNRWVGLTAGAFAGLLSVVPAFYGEWSRYTQGLGLAVLPVAWVLFTEVVDRKSQIVSQTADDRRLTTNNRRLTIYDLRSTIPLAVLSAAGIFLTHYRITIIYAAFAALYIAWLALVEWKSMSASQGKAPRIAAYIARIAPYLLSTALVALLTLLVLLPWLLNLSHNFVKNFIDKSGQNINAYFATAERLGADVLGHPSLVILAVLSALGLAILGWRTWRSQRAGLVVGLVAGLPIVGSALYIFLNSDPIALENNTQTTILGLTPVTWLLLLEIVALVVLLVGVGGRDAGDWRQKEALIILPALAWLILELWASPQLLPFGLPLVGYLDAVTLTSSAWLPACLLAGYASVRAWEWIISQRTTDNRQQTTDDASLITPVVRRPSFVVSHVALGLTCLLLALASGLALAPVNDRTPYIATADMEAFAWMRDNLPPNSYVLSDSFSFPWSPNQRLGLDAGLWLPLTTGARSSVPPISAYNEKPSDPDYFAQVQALAAAKPLPGDEASWQLLKTTGITDIYIGTRSAGDGYSVADLLNDPHVQLIFHRDGVWLFRVVDRKS